MDVRLKFFKLRYWNYIVFLIILFVLYVVVDKNEFNFPTYLSVGLTGLFYMLIFLINYAWIISFINFYNRTQALPYYTSVHLILVLYNIFYLILEVTIDKELLIVNEILELTLRVMYNFSNGIICIICSRFIASKLYRKPINTLKFRDYFAYLCILFLIPIGYIIIDILWGNKLRN